MTTATKADLLALSCLDIPHVSCRCIHTTRVVGFLCSFAVSRLGGEGGRGLAAPTRNPAASYMLEEAFGSRVVDRDSPTQPFGR